MLAMSSERIVSQNDPAIINALKSPKVDDFLMTVYVFDGKRKNPEDPEPEAGFIVTVDSTETDLPGVVSKGEKDLLIVGPFSRLPTIVKDQNVTRIEWCDEEILDLVRSAEGDKVLLRNPNRGPQGDEWDSPAYASFWGPIEQNLGRKTAVLQRIGKKVKFT